MSDGEFAASIVNADGGLRVVHAIGEIDLATARAFGEALEAALRAPGAAHVTVDLSEVLFLDARGLAVLVRGYRLATVLRRGFSVRHARGGVLKVLRVTGVGELLSASDDVAGQYPMARQAGA